MSKTIQLGTLAGLELAARPSALAGYLFLGLGLGMLGAFGPGLPAAQAVVFGAACALLHFGGELWHNLGHAAAARRAGYPMLGVTFWGLLATSHYPANEGQPPAGVHIQRALGGPLGSAALTVLAGLLLLAVKDSTALAAALGWFFFLDNLLVFCLGAFLPLGFTDGSTILYWLNKR